MTAPTGLVQGTGQSGAFARFAEMARTFREHGWNAFLQDFRSTVLFYLHTKIHGRAFGRHEPISISQTTEMDGLTIDSANLGEAVEYAPTPHLVLRWVEGLLPNDVSEWTFVDVGAGRGRVVLAAMRRPYRKVLGIEFAEELQADAAENVRSVPADQRRARDVEVRLADATSFSVPDGPCIFYLFNPFGASVLEAFLHNVTRAYAADPRDMRIAISIRCTRPSCTDFPKSANAGWAFFTRRSSPCSARTISGSMKFAPRRYAANRLHCK